MQRLTEKNKHIMTREFGFNEFEVQQIADFMYKNSGNTARDILDQLFDAEELGAKQKIVISYLIGTLVLETKRVEKEKATEKVEADTLNLKGYGG